MNVNDEFMDLETPQGVMRTYVYAPIQRAGRERALPGLVLYSEIFQQTGPIRRLALQFAGQGYLVMVPEVYHEHEPPGTVLAYEGTDKDKGNAYKLTTRMETFDHDAHVVIQALKSDARCNGRIGAVGFCLGGHLAYRAALHPEVLATACFYATDIHSGTLGVGQNADSLARAADIQGELMMIWGRQDPHIPEAGRTVIRQRLQEAGVCFTWHEFNGVHAFMRDDNERYDPMLARLAMGLALDLFHRAL